LHLTTDPNKHYCYVLKLAEQDDQVKVREERLTRTNDNTAVASYEWGNPPTSGTILRPDQGSPANSEIDAVSQTLQSFDSFELNPSLIERGNDPKHIFVGRDGFGVAGYLANLKDKDELVFDKLEKRLKQLRPETESIDVWAPGDEVFWGLKDRGQRYRFPAVHLSWGDRQLVGLLCVLYSSPPGGTIAIEEIDRGFHPSRYTYVIELLKEAVYKGLRDNHRTQIIVTTHSPSFVNRLTDLTANTRLVTRAPGGGTIVQSLQEALRKKLGTDRPDQPPGEIWESGLLEDVLHEALT
jgi:AAA domain, putative AbiEii toxin, Type IV TA system